MRTFVATKNQGKLAEMQAIFAGSVLELEVYPDYADVEEGSESYIENARLKAHALQRQLQAAGIRAAVLADDSGMEVDALGGRPGVLSARYAGETATWERRRQKLLDEMQNIPLEKRSADFLSAMVLVLDSGEEISAIGRLPGTVAFDVHGSSGFGYDPIFIPENQNRTFAEYAFAEKNRVSHRKRAADAIFAQLAARAQDQREAWKM